ncbi:uncharacterized protein LOC106777414 isoform X3 [Vigna radiata var. radiata]|uniref:Uncharacterized protein LOC106777414 isoform X3 n=1 Tax=Vigna radiata var. radiata TaxID=3916 RepID=A0A3Q0EMK4_VIGRR|nr:uncharacterized protein LOC106777414 isoform X3 [Vigna radiata var. radiata]
MLSILCVRTPKPNLSKHRVRYSPNYIFFAASSVALTTKSHLSLESPPNKSSNLGLAFDFTVFRCCTTSLRAPSRATRKQRMDAIESDNACGNRSKRRRRHLLLVGDVEEGGGERAEERELQDNLEKNTSEFNKLLQIPSEERDRVELGSGIRVRSGVIPVQESAAQGHGDLYNQIQLIIHEFNLCLECQSLMA